MSEALEAAADLYDAAVQEGCLAPPGVAPTCPVGEVLARIKELDGGK